MSGIKTPRSIVVPKDATPEQVRDIYDDFARTYDVVRSYIYSDIMYMFQLCSDDNILLFQLIVFLKAYKIVNNEGTREDGSLFIWTLILSYVPSMLFQRRNSVSGENPKL